MWAASWRAREGRGHPTDVTVAFLSAPHKFSNYTVFKKSTEDSKILEWWYTPLEWLRLASSVGPQVIIMRIFTFD